MFRRVGGGVYETTVHTVAYVLVRKLCTVESIVDSFLQHLGDLPDPLSDALAAAARSLARDLVPTCITTVYQWAERGYREGWLQELVCEGESCEPVDGQPPGTIRCKCDNGAEPPPLEDVDLAAQDYYGYPLNTITEMLIHTLASRIRRIARG